MKKISCAVLVSSSIFIAGSIFAAGNSVTEEIPYAVVCDVPSRKISTHFNLTNLSNDNLIVSFEFTSNHHSMDFSINNMCIRDITDWSCINVDTITLDPGEVTAFELQPNGSQCFGGSGSITWTSNTVKKREKPLMVYGSTITVFPNGGESAGYIPINNSRPF